MKKYFFLFCTMLILYGMYPLFHASTASTKGMNLTVLGDSITYGTGDPSKKGYVERVKGKLEERKRVPVRVSNFGVPKYTTEKILGQLGDRKITKQLQKADYVILYIGTNDFRKSAGYQFKQPNVKKVREGKQIFSENLHEILHNIRKKNSSAPIIVLGLYHPYVEYQNHQEILELIEQWNSEIVDVVDEFERTSFVPILDLFKNKPKKRYFSDSIHPNPAGYQLIADRLFKKLSYLEENKER